MRNSDFTKLLRQTAKVAEENLANQGRITDAFLARYGITHSDIDCDDLIDILDYGHGVPRNLGASFVDDLMTKMGHPPIST